LSQYDWVYRVKKIRKIIVLITIRRRKDLIISEYMENTHKYWFDLKNSNIITETGKEIIPDIIEIIHKM
jgi:hypothetical protein